jgi:MFS family permease
MPLTLTVLLSILNQASLKGSKMLVALYAIDRGASPLAIGALISTYALFPLVLAVYAGRVSDRIGVRFPMMLGAFGVATGLLLPIAWRAMPALYLSSALIGIASLFFHVSAHNLIGSLGEGRARTGNFATFSLGASVAGFIAPLVVGFMIDGFGHLAAYAVLAVIAAAPGLALACYAGFIPARLRVTHEPHASGVKEMLGNPALRRTLITGGLIITGIDLYNFYLPIYGSSIGLSASVIGIVLGMQAAAAFVVRLWMPRLASHYGERRVLTASLFVAGATYLVFPVAQSAVLLGFISFVLGLGLGCGQPLSIILTYNHSPAGRAGEALGLRLTVNKLTQIIVPVVFGSLGTAAGVFPVFWANGLLLLIGGYLSAEKEKRPVSIR